MRHVQKYVNPSLWTCLLRVSINGRLWIALTNYSLNPIDRALAII
jgi:hypothetical protein